MTDLPSSAKIVIVGGGIVGCSVAYHLGRMGITDVLLLERAKLSSGSTWHAAGLVGQLRTNANVTQLLGYSVALYDRLEKETGLATGWKMNGGLRLACNAERWTEVKRQATTRAFLRPRDASALAEGSAGPLAADDDRRRGRRGLPADRRPGEPERHRAGAGARRAQRRRHHPRGYCRSPASASRTATVRGVETADGFVACEKLVICAGQWSRAIGRMAGVNVPLVSVQHQYIDHRADRRRAAEPADAARSGPPHLLQGGGRRPDHGRLRAEPDPVGGGRHPRRLPLHAARCRLGPFRADRWSWRCRACRRSQNAGIKQLLNGPESFTPDGNFILGEAPEVRNVFVGAGFNAFGIASGGGAGMALAEWVAKGEPPYDLWPVDIRRFGRNHLDVDWVRTRTLEAYAKHYTMAWPFEEMSSGRPLRRSPLYDRLKAQGAVFGEKLGWERPNWFADAAAGEAGGGRLLLRPAELVRRGRARAPGGARARRRLRPDLVRQVPDGRPRRRGGALVDLRQRRREAAGLADLHADAERARRHRVRPDRRAARRGPLLHRHRHRLRHARFRLDQPQHSRRARRAPGRRHLAERRRSR